MKKTAQDKHLKKEENGVMAKKIEKETPVKTNYWLENGGARKKLLEELWPNASKEEILKAFPEKTWDALCNAAHRFRIRRRRKDEWVEEQTRLIKDYFPKSHEKDLLNSDRNKLKREIVMKLNDISMRNGLKLRSWHEILVEADKAGLGWCREKTQSSVVVKAAGDSLEDQFIAWLKKGRRTLEEASNRLDRSTKKTLEFVDRLRGYGYPIEIDKANQVVFWQDGAVCDGLTSLPQLTRNTFKLLVLSDINTGNIEQQYTLLHTLYDLVNKGYYNEKKHIDFRDINMVIVLGNLLAGHQRKGENQLFLLGFDAQTDYAIEHYPILTGGIKTYILSGPAELDLNKPKRKEEARDALQKVCLAREDLVHLGALGHTLRITGTDKEIFLAHTAKRHSRSLYTKSIPLQYVAHSFDDLSVLRKGKKRPAVIFLGGHHVFMADPPANENEERHALLVPSFCDPLSSYRDREKQGATPTIGFVITTIQFDNEKKNIINVAHEPHFWTNHQIKRDYLAISTYTDVTSNGNNGSLGEEELKVLKWLSAEPLTAGEISRRLNIPKPKVKEMTRRLERRNVRWDPAQKRYFLERSPRQKFESLSDLDKFVSKIYVKRVKRIVYSDTHLGSLWEQPHAIAIIREIIKASGVKEAYHCGDGLDGENLYGPKHKRNVYLFSSLDQRKRAAEILPKIQGVVTKIISGSHDMVFHTQSGEDPIKLLCAERPDLVYLGPFEGIATDEETGIKHMLFHPAGGVPKGRSYRPQGIIDTFSEQLDNLKDDVQGLFIGHLHIALAMFWRGVFCLLVPCCQARTEYMVQKGLHPRLGCWEIEQTVDEQNDPTRVRLVYHAIDPKEYEVEAKLIPVEKKEEDK